MPVYVHWLILTLGEDRFQSHLLLAGFLAGMFINTTYGGYSVSKCVYSQLSGQSEHQTN